jgi:succinate dehydrogenase / fumarate reductase cytochrome b subunit
MLITLLVKFYRSTTGKKISMAITGLVLVGFVIGHMVGNLKIFTGVDPTTGAHRFDQYAASLREIGGHLLGHGTALWGARIVLLGCFVLHVVTAIQLARINRAAKVVASTNPRYDFSTPSSRSMLFGGLFILTFVVYHILHLTLGVTHGGGFVEGRVFDNVVSAFRGRIVVVLFYVAAVGFLALHLYHGVWSMLQTLGVNKPRWNPLLRTTAKAVAVVLFLGFATVPIAVLLGALGGATQPPQRASIMEH